jgi:hypothetical protein
LEEGMKMEDKTKVVVDPEEKKEPLDGLERLMEMYERKFGY